MKKKTVVLRVGLLVSALTLAGVIGGCGGGGGGGSSSTTSTAATGGAVAGVAAKGILKGAKVTAYCGNSTAPADILDSGDKTPASGKGITDTAGNYSLSWTTTCNRPVKIVVQGVATTTMEDEAVGSVSADGITLRAYVADGSQKDPVHITPLTNMAAAIAENSGTVTADIVQGARQAIIDTVLNGNPLPLNAAPVSLANVATADQNQKILAATLTAISALASSAPDVACTGGSGNAAVKVQCAILAFETQAKRTVTNVASATKYTIRAPEAGQTPNAMITTKLTEIVANPITAGISGSVVSANSAAIDAIKNTTVAVVTPPSSTPVDVTTPPATSGIYAARDMFLSLYGDLMSLTGNGGFLSTKLDTINADWTAYGIGNGRSFINIFQGLTRATDMAYEAQNSAWTVAGASAANTLYAVPGNTGLYLLTGPDAAPLAYVRNFYDSDLQSTQNFMYCKVLASEKTAGKAACFYDLANFDVTATTPTGAYHAVTVAEGSTSGRYTWSDFTNATVNAKQSGEAVITRASGVVTAASLIGSVQPLVTGLDHSTLNVSAAVTTQTGAQTYAISSGTVNNIDASSVTKSSLSLSSGSQLVVTTGTAAHTSSVTMIAQIKTPAFQYDCTLAMSNFTASKNGEFSPALSTFDGKVSDLAAGVATEFLSGSIKAELTNLADYDPRLAPSDSGYVLLKEKDTFSGTVTVSSTKSYKLSSLTINNLAATATNGRQDTLLTYVNSASQSFTVSGVSYADTTQSTLTATGPGGVVVTLTGGAGDVKVNGTTVGTVDMKAQVTKQVRLHDSATNTTILM